MAPHPVIQKDIDELLPKDVTEPLIGGTGIYSNLYVVPKHTGGLQPIFNLYQFNCYMFILWILSDGYDTLFNKVIMLFLLMSRIFIYIFLLLSITIILMVCLAIQTISGEGFAVWAYYSPKVFTSLTKAMLFICTCKAFHVNIYFDDVLVQTHSKQGGKRAWIVLCSPVVCLGLHITFQVWTSSPLAFF